MFKKNSLVECKKKAKLREKLVTVNLLEKFHCKQNFLHPDGLSQSVLGLFLVSCNTHCAEVNSSSCVYLQSPANVTALTVQYTVKVKALKKQKTKKKQISLRDDRTKQTQPLNSPYL